MVSVIKKGRRTGGSMGSTLKTGKQRTPGTNSKTRVKEGQNSNHRIRREINDSLLTKEGQTVACWSVIKGIKK